MNYNTTMVAIKILISFHRILCNFFASITVNCRKMIVTDNNYKNTEAGGRKTEKTTFNRGAVVL